MPALNGKLEKPLHPQLFWDGNEGRWAVREGDWKLVFDRKGQRGLFNLEEDIGEQQNLANEHPELVKRLNEQYLEWRSEMGTPMSKRQR
jgi:hypothetical protein